MTRPKTLIYDALLQKGKKLLEFYVEEQVFSWSTKISNIWCLITWKSRFSHDTTENKMYIWWIITFRSRFSHDAPKTLVVDALVQKGANLLEFYVEEQVFSWRTKISYIWCINMTRPKTKYTLDALIRFVAGFLMTSQILLYLCEKSRFSHDVPKMAGFLMTWLKGTNLLQYYVSKQVFSWHVKKAYTWCIITRKSRFSHDAPKSLNLVHYYAKKQVFSWRNWK